MKHNGILDRERAGKLLMQTGLGLIIAGHLNFILGAVVHGTVLRHLTSPGDYLAIEYFTINILTIISGILSIGSGIAAIVLSRNLRNARLQWSILILTVVCAVLCAACMVGLSFSIVITIVNGGRSLYAACSFTNTGRVKMYSCPFDPTRIYDTTLALWFPSLLMNALEVVFASRCFILTLNLLGVKLGKMKKRKRKVVRIQVPPKELEDIEEENKPLTPSGTTSIWL
ncbi:transmembrane protein 54 isoform X3 [Protopterus annectens]|uniref:transmembrane protein 54 isoform X3 n=1 Tax=Protopterus annectens TaxID=7888 RepID=UPI001CFAFC52|nr:transmembrane protein 54 isoform X3 [Protopterus annectens]